VVETNGRTIDEHWPTARAVAIKLGCSRQQVYKLEKRGKLKGHDVREKNGVKIRRFDPAEVRELSQADELEQLLDVELVGHEDEDEDDAAPPNAMRLAAKVVGESRQVAVDARRGQHEAYELIAKPAREFSETLLRALEQREKRIAELEEKLNKFYDEQREARLEEREATLLQDQMQRDAARKDALFKVFTDNLPMVLEQLKNSMGAASGPFAEWMKKRSPAQQAKMIMAIEAVVGDDEPPAASSAEKGADAAS
jgi:hypothetical protein